WGVEKEEFVVCWQLPQLKAVTRWSNALGETLFGFQRMLCLSAGNQWVLVGTEKGEGHVLSAKSGTWKRDFIGPAGAFRSVALDPSETLAVLGTQKGHLRVVRIPSGETIADLPKHDQSVESIAISGDGRLLVTGALDQTVRLWRRTDAGFELLIALKAPPGRVSAGRLSPDQTKLAVLVEPERAVRLWHLDRLKARLAEMGLAW